MKQPEFDVMHIRWVIAGVVSIIALLMLVQRSPAPTFLARYDAVIVWLFLALSFLSMVCWWVALDAKRYSRLLARVSRIPFLLMLITAIASVFLLDLTTDIVQDALLMASRNALEMSVLSIVMSGLIMAALASESTLRSLKNSAVILTVTCLTILCLEAVFRGFLIEHMVPENEVEFELRVAESWPVRVPTEKPGETRRVLGLSDSFGLAGGARNFHYLIEETLANWNPPFDVVNFSVAGYELPEELALLTRFGAHYDPDVVLHGVFIGNDLWGSSETTQVSFRGIPLRLKSDSGAFSPGNFLIKQLFENVSIALGDAQKKSEDIDLITRTGTYSRRGFLEIEKKRLAICLKEIQEDEKFWSSAAETMDQVFSQSRRIGAQYVVVIHPDQFQVESALFQELVESYALDPQDYDLDQPQRFLRSFCKTQDIPCLDLLPAFRQQGEQGGLYLLNDTHYNNRGNELAAQEIVRLFESGVVDR